MRIVNALSFIGLSLISTTLSAPLEAVPASDVTNHNIPKIALDTTPHAAAKGQTSKVNAVAAAASKPNAKVKHAKGSRNGAKGDPVGKYFHESTFHAHYDGRYSSDEVPYAERREVLMSLIQSYFATVQSIGVESWIMHGTLLGWWWNKRIMPWDTDLDVMVSEAGAYIMATQYNMTTHHYQPKGSSQSREYLLEINPNYSNTSSSDKLNWIDGRYLDTETGLYIDITILHYGEKGVMRSKDNHTYPSKDLYPLKQEQFEGVPCLIPSGYENLLMEEYGIHALINDNFARHHFDQTTMDWIPIETPPANQRHSQSQGKPRAPTW